MPQAISDLKNISDYIGIDSPDYAKLLIRKIMSAVDQLSNFPEMGRKVPEFINNEYRELIFRNYRIIYQFYNSAIEILTIFHSSYGSGLKNI